MKTPGKPAAAPQHAADELLTQLSQAIVALRQVVSSEPSVPRDSTLLIERQTTAVGVRNLAAAFARVAQLQSALLNSNTEISPEIAPTLSHYKILLSQLKKDLPRIQGWLVTERARLATRGSHSALVERWVRATQQTRRA